MTSNGANNVEDADMAECDGQKVVTMIDVLREEQDFEDDANAVLGASDEKNCTYSKGYIKRQAIYACLTCCSEAKDDPTKRAGVCLACSLNCHENHELIELYTKRNFRCDCGNPKFNSHSCQFTPDKNDLNDDNNYNQNFSGLYCNCHRPYPDPESTIEDEEMIQCIICEDWLHASHLDAVVPGNDQYSEMICKACMEKNEFLHDYSNLAVNIEITDVDIIAVNGTDSKLSNGDLDNEKSMNGTGDATDKLTNDMDVVEEQTENISPKESGETMEKQELEKSVEDKESNDVTMEHENTEDSSQVFSDENAECKDDTKLTPTSEDTKATEVTLEGQSLEPQETKETSLDKPEESKDPQESEDIKEAEENTEQEMPEVEKTNDCSDNNAENIESTLNIEAKNEASDITESGYVESKDEAAEIALENDEAKNETTKTTSENEKVETKNDIISKNANEDETAQSMSEDLDTKQEEVSLTTENNDNSGETKTTSQENNSELNINEEVAETTNADFAKDEEETTNQTDSIEADKPTNELTSESDVNNSDSNIKFDEGPQGVNTVEELSMNEIKAHDETIDNIQENKECKRKLSNEAAIDDNLAKKPKLDEESRCTRPKGVKRVHKGATFWPSSFRQKLCTCSECLSMYKDLSVLFLIDPEDTVFAYEMLGKERVDGRATQYEKGLEALSSLDRIQQINALTEYNKMKDKLLEFLKSFKDRKEIVKEEDIKEFFAGMKPIREPDGVYFCR